MMYFPFCLLFFFHGTATPEIYTLSLHDALPIFVRERKPFAGLKTRRLAVEQDPRSVAVARLNSKSTSLDRKSTRLNSSHLGISYAVFFLKKNTGRLSESAPARPLI